MLRLTSDLYDIPLLRITLQPSPGNGLRLTSQVMIDKAATVPRKKLGERIGRADAPTMRIVDDALTKFLGLSAQSAG